MKPIRIINANFELLGEIDNYESMFFNRRWHGIDDIQITVNRYKRNTNLLQRGNIVIVGSDLHKAFIIKHREVELTDEGKISENWVIKGLGLKSIMSQRITIPPVGLAYDTMTDNAETVMLWYVYSNISEASDPKRNIPQLLLATNQRRGAILEWSSRYKNLAEELIAISTYSGLGWNVSLDLSQNRWVYGVSEGRDLTVDQSVLPPVIFSPQFDSLESLQYVESELNYINSAYVAGQGEGEARRIVEIGANAGLQRNEVFIDARDVEEVDEDDEPLPETTINATLVERGQQKLSEHTQELYVEGQILTKSPFKYEVDYDLGDIVTIQEKEWGVTTNSRITEIKEIYETSGFRIEATFGKSQPTIVEKIKKTVDKPLVEKNLDLYSTSEVDDKMATKSDTGHNHDDRYFTETEVNTKLATKSDTGHNHAGVYSPTNHNHDLSYIFQTTINVNNFDTIQKNGMYDGNNAIGAPTATTWFYVLHISHSANPAAWSMQIAQNFFTDAELYIRRSSDGGSGGPRVWSAWKKITVV